MSDNLARERAELRGKLGATQDQIKALQSTIDEEARRQSCDLTLQPDGLSDVAGAIRRGHGAEEKARSVQLQLELVAALRDNALLRQAIFSGDLPPSASPRLGHRTVSSTQLASSSRSTLSLQQRREVAELVRRQENLRQVQTQELKEQLKRIESERCEAEQKLVEAQSRSCVRSIICRPVCPAIERARERMAESDTVTQILGAQRRRDSNLSRAVQLSFWGRLCQLVTDIEMVSSQDFRIDGRLQATRASAPAR